MCAAVQQHGRNVVLDPTGVDAIDAAGIGLLISLQAAGIYLKLLNPTRQVRDILRFTQVDSIFEISESTPSDQTTEACTTENRPESPSWMPPLEQ